MEFINAKLDGRTLQNFNLSVGVTEAFMQAVREGERFILKHPGTGHRVDILAARQIFDGIVEAAWQTGDPGLLFLDAIHRANPTPQLGAIEATNPCGEIPLLPYEACNLGSINVARMLRESGGKAGIDWDKLAATVGKAVRFLDNVIEVNKYPAPEMEWLGRRGLDTEGLMLEIRERGHLGGVSAVPREVRRLFVTALEVIPKLNEKDLPDVTEEVKKKLKFTLVENVDEVLAAALEGVRRKPLIKPHGARKVSASTRKLQPAARTHRRAVTPA